MRVKGSSCAGTSKLLSSTLRTVNMSSIYGLVELLEMLSSSSAAFASCRRSKGIAAKRSLKIFSAAALPSVFRNQQLFFSHSGVPSSASGGTRSIAPFLRANQRCPYIRRQLLSDSGAMAPNGVVSDRIAGAASVIVLRFFRYVQDLAISIVCLALMPSQAPQP